MPNTYVWHPSVSPGLLSISAFQRKRFSLPLLGTRQHSSPAAGDQREGILYPPRLSPLNSPPQVSRVFRT